MDAPQPAPGDARTVAGGDRIPRRPTGRRAGRRARSGPVGALALAVLLALAPLDGAAVAGPAVAVRAALAVAHGPADPQSAAPPPSWSPPVLRSPASVSGARPPGPPRAVPPTAAPPSPEPSEPDAPPPGAQRPSPPAQVPPAQVPPAPPPGAGVPAPGARYAWPLLPAAEVVGPFRAPAHAYGPGHRGVDLAGATDQPVLAARAGTVVFAGPVAGRPLVSVQHDDGLRTTYEPVRPAVAAGDVVAAGAVLGALAPGHAGCAATCLHWGVRRERTTYLDPLVLLRPARVRLLPVPEPWPDP